MVSSSLTILSLSLLLLPLITAQSYPVDPIPTSTISPHPYKPYTTVYTTAYIDICPTGLTTKTYTLTQTCSTNSTCHIPTRTGIPEHFTTTTKVCHACPGIPTLTVTCPVETEMGRWRNGTGTATGYHGAECIETGSGKLMPPVPTVTKCEGHGCPEGAKTAAGVPTPPPSGSGCGAGESCPPSGGNGTGPHVTAGAEGRFVSGVEILVLGAFVAMASSILLL
ncbi:hypothetical protein DL98DRAFT_256135 [Cadophora sp. DSE1049]|nr:hypothetical protein DL98DRAFT_256135 [Cadophora sp. DSE1049]